MENVVIDPACFVGLVTSAIEAYNRETNGFLIGAERARKLRRFPQDVAVLKAAYPIQTADRNVNWVGTGNGRAFERARGAVANANGGLDLLGGYHSHTGSDARAGLSPGCTTASRPNLARRSDRREQDQNSVFCSCKRAYSSRTITRRCGRGCAR